MVEVANVRVGMMHCEVLIEEHRVENGNVFQTKQHPIIVVRFGL